MSFVSNQKSPNCNPIMGRLSCKTQARFDSVNLSVWHDSKRNAHILQNTQTGKYVTLPDNAYGLFVNEGDKDLSSELFIYDRSHQQFQTLKLPNIVIADLPKTGPRSRADRFSNGGYDMQDDGKTSVADTIFRTLGLRKRNVQH